MRIDDTTFLGYCQLHSQTQRALFSGADVQRLLDLMGEDSSRVDPNNFYPIYWDEMSDILDQIKKRREAERRRLEEIEEDKRREALWTQYLTTIDTLF